jgi:hypothetical protein
MPTSGAGRIRLLAAGFSALARVGSWDLLNYRRCITAGRRAIEYSRAFNAATRDDIVVNEFNIDLISERIAKDNRFKTVLCPQNIENLVPKPNYVTEIPGTARTLTAEMSLMTRAKSVVTISREECWLAGVANRNSFYAPYVPARSEQVRLQKLCERRSPGRDVLVFGGFGNTPSFLGLLAQLEIWAASKVRDATLVLAGGSLDRLAGVSLPSRVRVEGWVDDNRLASLLASARCVWIHQTPTSGFVTRFIDLALAGVPIVANRIAARSAPDWVEVYENPHEFRQMLDRDGVSSLDSERIRKEVERLRTSAESAFEHALEKTRGM